MSNSILYVHHRAEVSGAARSLAALVAQLDERWEPHVFTPEGPVVRLFEEAGARVTTGPVALFQHTWDNRYTGRKRVLLGREGAALAPHLLGLRRLLRANDFALVHLNDSPLIPAAAVAKRHGLPVVWHLRSALSDRGVATRRLVLNALDRWGDHAIAIDKDVARSFTLRIPTTVVYNSVAVPPQALTVEQARERLGLPAEPVTIGFIGNLRRVKGWPEFVEAAALLADEHPVQFVVVGGGVRPPSFFRTPYGRTVASLGLASDDESEMRALVRERGLERSFTFLPFTNDVATVYPALDVVTFPNQGSGLGRPVLEAAAFGRPAVAAGSPDGAGVLIPDETGILLQQPTASSLAAALRPLIRDENLRSRLGDAAKAYARTWFTPESSAAAVTDVYERVLTASGRRTTLSA